MHSSPRPPRLPNLTLRTLLTLGLLAGLACVAAWVAAYAMEVDGPVAFAWALVAVLIGFGISPIILDLSLRFFYTSTPRTLDELPTHLSAFIRRTCKAHGMRPPKLRELADGTPTAFTYGWSPSTARVVYSQGLLELLSPLEAEAVIGHELGHAKSWDILVASIASAVPTFIRELGDRVAASLSEHSPEDDDDDTSKRSRAVLWVLRALAFAAELTELSLSRVRELHADRFGATACGSAAAMARALIKVSYGLAARRSTAARAVSPALQVQGHSTAHSLLLASGGRPADAVQHAMAWDLWSPWARVLELQSTHPTTARRILALEPLSELQRETPAVRFQLEQEGSLWGPFLVDLVFATLPTAALLGGLWALERRGLDILGPVLIAFGCALGAKYWFKYRGRDFKDATVADLLGILEASPIRGIPCTVRGRVVGRGEAGLAWGDDLTLRDETGLVLVDHRQPLAVWELLRGLFGTVETVGSNVVVEGWFRRGPVPFLEMKSMTIDGSTRRSYFRWLPYGVAGLSIICGTLLQLGLYESLVAQLGLT